MGRPKKDEEFVDVPGKGKVNIILTKKQRLGLLAEALRSETISPSDLVKLVASYEELLAENPASQKFTLVIKDKE